MRSLALVLAACAAKSATPAVAPAGAQRIAIAGPSSIPFDFPGVSLVASTNSAIHSHGGDGAMIDVVELAFEVNDHRAHSIEVRRVELLHRGCNAETWRARDALELVEHRALADQRPVARGIASVTLPARGPQRYAVHVAFEPVEVYNACDVFGFAIDVVVDRVRQKFEIPLHVTREE